MNADTEGAKKGTSQTLFESNRERTQMTVITAGFVLAGLVASGRPGSEDELIYDAYKLARRFVARGESLAVHGDITEDDGNEQQG